MKFKVGDVVKNIKGCGLIIKNKLYTVKGKGGNLHIEEGEDLCNCYNDWVLIKRKGGKEVKVNFLLKYDLEEDPIEEFETELQVKERIKELSERSDLQEDSLVVYDVSKVRKITLKRELVIEGL